MATKKKTVSRKETDDGADKREQVNEAYEKALGEFASAWDLLNKGDFATALSRFEKLGSQLDDEPLLAERARTYANVCRARQAPRAAEPMTVDELYYQAVLHNNNGEPDAAVRVLDQALQQDPTSARLLYARASAWALKGNAESAVSDLRQAISSEPQVRFQAANDSDFEQIREEPIFINIIEPTPAGV